MKTTIGIVCLVAGLGLGYVAGRQSAPRAEVPRPAVEDGTKAKLAKAQARISELEKRLKDELARARKAKTEVAKVDEKKKDVPGATIEIGKDANVEDQLKKQLTDEQFTQVTNAFAELKARLAQRAKNRYDYLAGVDTARMTAKEKAAHERYLKLFSKREEIRNKMKNGIPDVGAIEEMVKLGVEMSPLAKQERTMLTRQVAQELGYQGDDVDTFHDTMQQIYDCTNSGGLGGLDDLGAIGIGGGDGPSVEVQTQVIAE